MNLFDASALLWFLRGEEGADLVEREPTEGGACSAANWSEVAQKTLAHDAAGLWCARCCSRTSWLSSPSRRRTRGWRRQCGSPTGASRWPTDCPGHRGSTRRGGLDGRRCPGQLRSAAVGPLGTRPYRFVGLRQQREDRLVETVDEFFLRASHHEVTSRRTARWLVSARGGRHASTVNTNRIRWANSPA